MAIGLLGENLIFLISQPRAGSTLLQRILAGHPQIYTRSESWLMLLPLYMARRQEFQPEDEVGHSWMAVRDFLTTLPNGQEDYLEATRRMYAYLYDRALASSGKTRFLDKTPRYYLILPDLCRTFPNARYIVLLRNPLAVLMSILQTWSSDNWLSLLGLYRFRGDLLEAPRLILEGITLLGDRATVLHYEALVTEPEREIRRLCERLDLEFAPAMIEYRRQELPAWNFGDLKTVNEHERPVADYAERWQAGLTNPQAWRLAHEYLECLGQATVEQLGFSYLELQQSLEASRPPAVRLWFTVSLRWLLNKSRARGRTWERRVNRWQRQISRRLQGVRRASA
jgi:hypothetical protein